MIALLVVASVLDSGTARGSGPPPPVTASAPPLGVAEAGPCGQLLQYLPVRLDDLTQRRVVTNPNSPFVLAWGDPAIVLRCGVAKPAGFGPGSDKELFPGGNLSGAWYYVSSSGDSEIYTAIDRAAYVSFTIPGKYQGADYLPDLNAAILKAMPTAVCSTDPAELDVDKLCSRRTG